jgi:hypothetical protein
MVFVGCSALQKQPAPSTTYDPAQGNRWVSHVLKMPSEMVTGGVDSVEALRDGTFSDEIDPEVLLASDMYVADCWTVEPLVLIDPCP